ncbi:MAG: ABC transporter permease, partial [Actinomycetes bacterium]
GSRRAAAARRARRGPWVPYWLALPGTLWLAIFFVVPMVAMLSLSTQTGNLIDGFQQTFHVQNYVDALSTYHTEFLRSLWYGLVSTVLAIVISYPAAYWIAFHGGTRKSSYLFLMLLPFFVSFVIRTVSWKFVLADNGLLLGPLKSLHLLPENYHVLATSYAVIGGLTYNSLPFMLLPIYVALERIEPRLLEAARDLYSDRRSAFRRVVLPLSLPGVFAGVLLTFIPNASDFVNATILGGTNTTMIGNIIDSQYFTNNNYPIASALSFCLMLILLLGIFLYARLLGTQDVLEVAAA